MRDQPTETLNGEIYCSTDDPYVLVTVSVCMLVFVIKEYLFKRLFIATVCFKIGYINYGDF